MNGLKVGHFTNTTNGTGLSVFLLQNPAVGSYFLAGSGPASLELTALEPETSVGSIHGLLLTGGSALGLYAAKGVANFLVERGIGLKLPHGVIPIVPAAAIYDLAYRNPIPPNDEDAYQACLAAEENNTASGRIGAGTGATIGKVIPDARRMSGGIGRAEIKLANGVQVEAYAVVNAVGDVRGPDGRIIAGARSALGNKFANCEQYIISGKDEYHFFKRATTTLVAIFTNAKFSKSELKRISKMASAGMARAISPVFTCYDGDMLFSISLGDKLSSVMTIGMMAAETVRLAILDAVQDSEIIL